MAELLVNLEVLLGKPVQDETGIRGNFGFEIAFDKSQVRMFGGLSADAKAPDGPSISSAFANDLNISMRLEQRPVAVVVVIHAARPTPN